ncbi:fungal specific transcription factor [Hirsutella rhossiliensis]|uniref:Fungal specific transcription factor domain-containing protein n=1 Tax=Hirsutella rhossiliensis TaxID=111463 RepID=A0A9P8N6P3_9HYPO|nr:fungal specific transcription factor domain-containing protein [Hirsutella rhossiliensis]KAH0967522.1 fungal specific transcription factor domain-containing protein [Hirsutella rhossiliensis]
MASLRNIMNVDDDHADSLSLKKPKESVPRFPQHPESAPSTASYASRQDLSISSPSPSSSARAQRQSSSSRLAVEAPASPFPLGHASDNAAPGRHQSVTSTDSMDSSYGQSFAPAYTHGHPGAQYSGAPVRPFVPTGDAPVKLTPITGRVSRAKKGLAVHICELCRPPKTFTRAEHLRRHQLSHQPPDLRCQVPGCDKVFHRKDLLERHQQRHSDQDERHAPDARRRSSSRSNGPTSPLQGNYSGQQSGSPLQMPPTYNSPPPVSSPTSGVSTRGIPMAPGPWSSPSNSTPRLRDTQDFTMGGVKTEYPMESLSNLESIPFRVSSAFSGSRSGHGLGLMDVPGLCMPAVGPEPLAVSWTESSGLVSSGSGSNYSTPPPSDASHGHHSVLRSSSAEWAGPLGPQLVARDMQSPGIGAGDYPPPFGYGTSPPQVYPSIYGEANNLAFSGYEDSLYSSPVPSTTARSLSPQMAVGQCSETLITAPSALPADRMVNSSACDLQPETAFGLLTAQDFMPVSLSREALSVMPAYLDLYWDKVHPNYPIIHRATFEDASGVDAEHLDVLRCAMAAVATQFLGHRDNRINGSQLHAYAWQVSKASATWSLPIMQAVLLCEYYARFRGRSKEAYRPSLRFNTLCQMVASQHIWEASPASSTDTQRWREWVRLESCRRLLAACFLLSVHGNWYYEQPFTADLGLDNFSPMMLSIPLSANSTQAWEAESVELWAAFDVAAIRVQTVGDMLQQKQTLTPSSIESMPSFDASLLLAAHALQLPRRRKHTEVDVLEDASSIKTDTLSIVRLFPRSPGAYVYLALHYTPLHWLLSVSGDSWVFNKKVPQARSFMEHQRKLDKWRNSGSAAVATLYAAKALKIFLSLESSTLGNHQARLPGQFRTLPWRDISDFWGLYVCSLICWAFGHVGKPNANKSSRAAAAQWIAKVAELQPGPLQALAGREDSQGVVGLVRDVLERDCLGGRSILYADAVGVLRKLEEGDNWKRF